MCVGGPVASWLVRSTPDWALRVRALARDIVLCSWARHLTLTVSLWHGGPQMTRMQTLPFVEFINDSWLLNLCNLLFYSTRAHSAISIHKRKKKSWIILTIQSGTSSDLRVVFFCPVFFKDLNPEIILSVSVVIPPHIFCPFVFCS